MPERRKEFSPGMRVRLAAGREASSWLNKSNADLRAPGVVLGRGWGVDTWRVRFPAATAYGKPCELPMREIDLVALADETPSERPREKRELAPVVVTPVPGTLLSLLV